MKISRSETMSRKSLTAKIYRSETEVRFFHTKKCQRQTHRLTDRHSRLEKALLALKMYNIYMNIHMHTIVYQKHNTEY